jgi:arylsulfatase A-like enzyme
MASCTPTLDMMRAEGIELGTLYAAPSCTASRASLLTAYYPANIGMQHADLKPAQPWSLAPGVRTLAQNLRDEGFWTALVGKWHLGHYLRQATPTYRGFDEFFGFYGDSRDYFSRVSLDSCELNKAAYEPSCFWDAVDGDANCRSAEGAVSTAALP